jgi:hypothetical protein
VTGVTVVAVRSHVVPGVVAGAHVVPEMSRRGHPRRFLAALASVRHAALVLSTVIHWGLPSGSNKLGASDEGLFPELRTWDRVREIDANRDVMGVGPLEPEAHRISRRPWIGIGSPRKEHANPIAGPAEQSHPPLPGGASRKTSRKPDRPLS